jgi:hypothetical protein
MPEHEGMSPGSMYEAGREVFVGPEADENEKSGFDNEYDQLVEAYGAEEALKMLAEGVKEKDPELWRDLVLKSREAAEKSEKDIRATGAADAGGEYSRQTF